MVFFGPPKNPEVPFRTAASAFAAPFSSSKRNSEQTHETLVHSQAMPPRVRPLGEEVVQNAFVKAFQNLDSFRGDSRFYTWLVRIAEHPINRIEQLLPWNLAEELRPAA
jgi:DNA-directed RNA polymerase specialized sigma24 family protein